MKILTIASILGLQVLIGAATASADVAPAPTAPAPALSVGSTAQFTFNVPVQLHAIHQDNNAFSVHCSVGRRGVADWFGSGRQMGSLDGNGNFAGTVTVKLNVNPSRDPAEAQVYRCGLYLIGRAESAPCLPDATHCAAVGLRAKPGTQFRHVVEGSIP
jgi:hypothetical protein